LLDHLVTIGESIMLTAYINYPRSRISVHHNSGCSRIQVMQKSNQRTIHINNKNSESKLNSFRNKEIKFASKAECNDLWVFIDFAESLAEDNCLEKIKDILGGFYKPLADAKIEIHC